MAKIETANQSEVIGPYVAHFARPKATERNIIILLLLIALTGMTWLAVRNAKPLNCDAFVETNGSVFCEIKTNEGAIQQ